MGEQLPVSFEDLTARARIRDVALRLFAERGIDNATVRDIAKAAGVSAGLIRHHFGSKEALRDACDQYALEQLIEVKSKAVVAGQLADFDFLPAAHPTILLLMRYFARSMVDGSPAAATLFDQLVDFTDQWLALNRPGQFQDRRGYAAVLVAMQLGPLVLNENLSRALGANILEPDGHLRMARAFLELHTTTLMDGAEAERAFASFDELQARRNATATGRNPAAEGVRP